MSKYISEELVEQIVEGLEEIKGEGITVLDLRSIENSVCDFFVIANAQSGTQVRALGNSVEKVVFEKSKEKPWHVEGLENLEWVLMDYVSVVVHIFRTEARAFYDLESLWGDAPVIGA